MGTFAVGQVVVLPFPFSDLSRKKLRPALLLADAGRGDWIACQITSNPYADARAITLASKRVCRGWLTARELSSPRQIIPATGLFLLIPLDYSTRLQCNKLEQSFSDDSRLLGMNLIRTWPFDSKMNDIALYKRLNHKSIESDPIDPLIGARN